MGTILRAAAALLVCAAVAVVAGCTAEPEPAPVPNLVGETLLDLRPSVTDETLLIYDISLPVLGIDPAYNDGQPQGRWEIVAQCLNRGTVAVAVLPADEVTAEIQRNASDSQYDETIADCS